MLEAIEGQSGNAQLLEVYTRADEIAALSKAWVHTAEGIAKRLPADMHAFIGNVLSMAISTLLIIPLIGLLIAN